LDIQKQKLHVHGFCTTANSGRKKATFVPNETCFGFRVEGRRKIFLTNGCYRQAVMDTAMQTGHVRPHSAGVGIRPGAAFRPHAASKEANACLGKTHFPRWYQCLRPLASRTMSAASNLYTTQSLLTAAFTPSSPLLWPRCRRRRASGRTRPRRRGPGRPAVCVRAGHVGPFWPRQCTP